MSNSDCYSSSCAFFPPIFIGTSAFVQTFFSIEALASSHIECRLVLLRVVWQLHDSGSSCNGCLLLAHFSRRKGRRHLYSQEPSSLPVLYGFV